MRIEIHDYTHIFDSLTLRRPPTHTPLLHSWGVDDSGYPRVVDIPGADVLRIERAFAEFKWAQERLRGLNRGPEPNSCQCGNCPGSS